MKLYLLLEGKRGEAKIYPAWLASLDRPYSRIMRVDERTEAGSRSFYSFSANGYPSIVTHHLQNAIEDIKQHGGYDWLVVCLDSDEASVAQRIAEVERAASGLHTTPTRLFASAQGRCIESWLLGNPKLIGAAPPTYVAELRDFYDIRVNCPEAMGHPRSWSNHAQFHFHYLREVFKAKKIVYSKSNPGDAATQTYFEALVGRLDRDPKCMPSLRRFVEFVRNI